MRGKSNHSRSAEAHIKKSAGQHRTELFHHLDFVFNRRLKREQVVTVHNDFLALQLNDDHFLSSIRQVNLTLPFRLREQTSHPPDRRPLTPIWSKWSRSNLARGVEVFPIQKLPARDLVERMPARILRENSELEVQKTTIALVVFDP